MHVLITGGAGFIGSHLAERHLANGDQVYVVDNLSTGSLANLEAFRGHSGFRFAEADILDWNGLDEALGDRAYASSLGAAGIEGESWLELWARAVGLRPAQLTAVPGFVTQWAGPAVYRGY